MVGLIVGDSVGDSVGDFDGTTVGDNDGYAVGDAVSNSCTSGNEQYGAQML